MASDGDSLRTVTLACGKPVEVGCVAGRELRCPPLTLGPGKEAT